MGRSKLVGRRINRKEDLRFLKGKGLFVDDIQLPGMVHLAILRSAYAHARIRALDKTNALGLPGVVDIVSGDDLTGAVPAFPPFLWKSPPVTIEDAVRPLVRQERQFPLAIEKVRYVGEPVAAVLAADRYVAEDAREMVEVEYDPLPVVENAEQGLEPDAPLVHEEWRDNVAVRLVLEKGDVDQAFASAHRVFKERFQIQRYTAVPIETRGVLATYGERYGSLTVWSSTQVPHALQETLAAMLNLPEHLVHVIAPDVGGGFGVKGLVYPEEILVAYLAMKWRCPVKWIEDRQEHFLSSIHARDQVHQVEIALAADGRILGIRDQFVIDNGAYNPLGLVTPYNTAAHLQGLYKVPSCRIEGRVVATNKVPGAPYRGTGRPVATFVMERILDIAARGLGLDPSELRFRNLIQPHDMPYDLGLLYRDGTPLVYESGNYPLCLRKALERVDYEHFRREQTRLRREGRYLGVGIACYIEGTGVGPFEGASVRVERSGKVVVSTGACSQGQGHETSLAQICADELGVTIEDVTIVGGDTAAIPFGWGTVASRSAVVAGNAVRAAARNVRKKVFAIAAPLLAASPGELELAAGKVSVAGRSTPALSLAEISLAASPGRNLPEGIEPGLESTYYFVPPAVSYTNGVHGVTLEVDAETGEVRLLKYVVVHDCGRIINPLIVEGQVVGGVAQGIGGTLYEELVYNEGQLLSGTFVDYLVPTATEVPEIEVEHVESPTPLNPLGIKGLGEGGAIAPPAAIANAIEDALSPFGVRVAGTPLGPHKILNLLDQARHAQARG